MTEDIKPLTLTKEEMERSANRLSTQHRKEVQLKPLVARRTITPEARDRSVKHLYNDSMEHRKRKMQEIEENVNAEIDRYHSARAKIDAEEEDALVRRVYNDSIERKNQKMKELYDRELASLVRKNKVLGKEEQVTVVSRLYNEGMENNRKKHIALFEKYVVGRQTKAVQRSREEMEEACDRLCRGEGVTSA